MSLGKRNKQDNSLTDNYGNGEAMSIQCRQVGRRYHARTHSLDRGVVFVIQIPKDVDKTEMLLMWEEEECGNEVVRYLKRGVKLLLD
jgi:hypothetical protein